MPSRARKKRAPAFVDRERSRQVAYLSAGFPGNVGYRGSSCRLNPSDKRLNLAPAIRDVAANHFREKGIAWHQHANHGLSSQVCCLNFLMPLAERPQTLSKLVGAALAIENPQMLEVEPGPDGRPWFIGFEWNGGVDYLNEANEAGTRTRGANSTSADAFVRFRHNGRDEGLLIEWKYTESYGAPIPAKGNATRIERYKDIAFAPNGPLRIDRGLSLKDFFFEPFYQLLRQQMLAFQMEKAREDGVNRVRVLHIAPSANRALRRVTSPALARSGDDAFSVFSHLLREPTNFVSRRSESLFRPLMSNVSESAWADYLSDRYAFLSDDELGG